MIKTRERTISIFLPSMRAGGAERSMLKLAQGIAERNYSVDLVLARAEGPHISEIPDSVRVIDLNAPRVLRSLPGLVRYLRKVRPEVLLSAMDYANVVALWARQLAGTPSKVVVNEQNTISRSSGNSHNWRGRVLPMFMRRFYPWANHIIGNSEGVADDLCQVLKLPRDRIQVIYNPVGTSDLRQLAKEPIDHDWFKPGQPPVVLAVGRLTSQKDYPTLIRAFEKTRRTRHARLLILGDGRERPMLEALIRKLGLQADVSLPGFVQNPYAYMSRAALYVLSSRYEGLPTVLIEALYCGARIVSTDCPSGPREILMQGQYGQLVPVQDENRLALAMESALVDDRPLPSEESQRPFDLDCIVDQYIRLLLDTK